MLVLPLYTVTQSNEMHALDTILGYSSSAMQAIEKVGTGLASIFVLFAIFIYVSNILDGGKFQVKMLWPLGIYLLCCNFGIVRGPALSVLRIINKECYAGTEQVFQSVAKGDGISEDDCVDFYTYFMALQMKHVHPDTYDETKEKVEDYAIQFMFNTPGPDDEEASADGTGETKWKLSGLSFNVGKDVTEAIQKWWDKMISDAIKSLVPKAADMEAKYAGDSKKDAWAYLQFGFVGLLAALFQFILNIVQRAIVYLGAILIAIIITFGAFTWSFAIFPGNQKVIGSWFIRLFQFSLWGPLLYLIRAFCFSFMSQLVQASGGGSNGMSCLALIVIIVCCLVAMTAIPSISSMIIEGAQGSVSLSQGLQTISSSITMATSMLMSPVKAYQTGVSVFEGNRDRETQDILRDIRNNSTPGGGGGGSSPSGMNTHSSS